MNRSDEPFLSRWSRLKREGATGEEDRAAPEKGPAADKGDAVGAGRPRDGEPANGAGEPGEHAARRRDGMALEEVKSIDIDALHFDSDFECFMQKGVPDELRNKALRKLWTSNPIFGHIDGLDDYCEDFSDAVWVSPAFKTAYRIGRGFLSDEEVLAAEEADKPQRAGAATVASTSAGRDLTAGETEGGQSDIGGVGVAEPDPAAELAMNEEACDPAAGGDGGNADAAAPGGTVSGKRA